MRTDATFIGIEIPDDAVGRPGLAARLAEVCPVDIYADEAGRVTVVETNVDECILCGMCIKASDGSVVVHKLYSGKTLEAPAT